MIKYVGALVIGAALALSGCSSHQPPKAECPEGFDPAFRTELQGLTLIEATQKVELDGGVVRVLYNNGESLAGTNDFREERVNLALDHNIVICASKG